MLVVTLAGPSPANATWTHSSEIVRGSAQVLEKGEISVGIFAPLQYGLTDRVTIASHPVLDLLQMLNFSIRARLVQEDTWLLSLTGGFKWQLLDAENTERPLEIDAGVIATWLPHKRVAASLLLSWSPKLERDGDSTSTTLGAATEHTFQNGFASVSTANFIVTDKHMVMASLRLVLNTTAEKLETPPTLTIGWVSSHSFFLGDVDVVLGASFGRFRIRDAVFFASGLGGGDTESAWYPVVDVVGWF